MVDQESPVSLEDTQPRKPVLPVEAQHEQEEEARRGCGSTLLISLVVLGVLFMMLATVALAGVAGWRDGGLARQTQRAAALVGTLDRQATLAWEGLANKQYELSLARCEYIATLQPLYTGLITCISTARSALSATPTPTLTLTPTPPPDTPVPTPPAGGEAGYTPEALFALGQEALRRPDYEAAMGWLEALRALDGSYRRQEVEDMLVQTYLALGEQYKVERRLSEMVVVIRKALKIRSLPDTDWAFTIDVTELYLSARSHLDSGQYALAAQVFATLMERAPNYLDTKTLACRAFSQAGASASSAKYCQ